jgi:hypothetical protein
MNIPSTRLASVVGNTTAVAYFFFAAIHFFQMAPDPQHGVGYLFIALYAAVIGWLLRASINIGSQVPALFGECAFASSANVSRAETSRRRTGRVLRLIQACLLSAALLVAAVVLVVITRR